MAGGRKRDVKGGKARTKEKKGDRDPGGRGQCQGTWPRPPPHARRPRQVHQRPPRPATSNAAPPETGRGCGGQDRLGPRPPRAPPPRRGIGAADVGCWREVTSVLPRPARPYGRRPGGPDLVADRAPPPLRGSVDDLVAVAHGCSGRARCRTQAQPRRRRLSNDSHDSVSESSALVTIVEDQHAGVRRERETGVDKAA